MAIGTTAAILGAAAIGAGSSVAASSVTAKASGRASAAQLQGQEQAITEQRRQFDATRELLQPFVAAGSPALQEQLRLLGLAGPGEQQAAVSQQEQSPLFQALARQGEEAILQNASATGGLRGGNVQGALAQFRPQLLNQFLEQQYGRLGGMTSLGQRSAVGVGAAGADTAGNISTLLQGQGRIAAGQELAQGQAQANLFGGIGQAANTIGGFAASGGFGGGSGFSPAPFSIPQFTMPQFAAPTGLPSGPVAPLFGG